MKAKQKANTDYRPLRRIVAIVRHFIPDVWPWEGEAWACSCGGSGYLGERILDLPFTSPASRDKKRARRLLPHAGEFLARLSLDPQCRLGKRPWRNLEYCPPSPIGQYHWRNTVIRVICIRNAEAPLFEGWRYYVENHSKPDWKGRDGCHYMDPVRHAEWDAGYLLALGWTLPTDQKELRHWIKAQEARMKTEPQTA